MIFSNGILIILFLQDIVTRHLTEKSVAEEPGSSLGPGSQSELTPSESLATTDNVRHTHTHTSDLSACSIDGVFRYQLYFHLFCCFSDTIFF